MSTREHGVVGSYSWVVGQPSGSPRQIQNAQMHNANDGSGKPRGLVLNLDPVERIAAIDDAVASREMRSIRIVMKATGQPSSGARLFFRDMSLNALVQPGRSRVGDAFDVSHVSGQVYVADREGVVSVEWPRRECYVVAYNGMAQGVCLVSHLQEDRAEIELDEVAPAVFRITWHGGLPAQGVHLGVYEERNQDFVAFVFESNHEGIVRVAPPSLMLAIAQVRNLTARPFVFGESDRSVELKAGSVSRDGYFIELPLAAKWDVQAHDGHGKAVTGIRVTQGESSPRPGAVCARQTRGGAELIVESDGVERIFLVQAPGFEPKTFSVRQPGPANVTGKISVALEQLSACVRLRLVSNHGVLANCCFSLFGSGGILREHVYSDDGGVLNLRRSDFLPHKGSRILIRQSGLSNKLDGYYGKWLPRFDLPEGREPSAISMNCAPVLLRGQVVDGHGGNIHGADIKVFRVPARGAHRSNFEQVASLQSSGDGTFVVMGYCEESQLLASLAYPGLPSRDILFAPGEGNLHVVLNDGLSLSGTVLAPIADPSGWLYVEACNETQSFKAAVDAGGNFLFDGLPGDIDSVRLRVNSGDLGDVTLAQKDLAHLRDGERHSGICFDVTRSAYSYTFDVSGGNGEAVRGGRIWANGREPYGWDFVGDSIQILVARPLEAVEVRTVDGRKGSIVDPAQNQTVLIQ